MRYLITGHAVVIQQNEEDDCAWYVDEGVDDVDTGHESWKLEEPALDVELEEYAVSYTHLTLPTIYSV